MKYMKKNFSNLVKCVLNSNDNMLNCLEEVNARFIDRG